jgi:[acyl-carrier-protein] S-malonyltransferase
LNNFKKSFVFPGQGAQQVGMGLGFYEKFSWVKDMWQEANEIIGYDLENKVFNGPEEELKHTRNTQPAVYMTEIIMLEALKRSQLEPDITAGHSLGEYAAVVASGALDWKQGLDLVKTRGERFEEVAKLIPCCMLAVIGLEEDQLSQILSKIDGVCEIVNYNSPGQLVVSAEESVIEEAQAEIKTGGAKIVVKLEVSGGFHSSLMDGAVGSMKKKLDEIEFKDPTAIFYSNVTGEAAATAADIKDCLLKQVNSPVRWTTIINNMIEQHGQELKFFEVGPGKVLQGLLKRINRRLDVSGISAPEDVDNIISGG